VFGQRIAARSDEEVGIRQFVDEAGMLTPYHEVRVAVEQAREKGTARAMNREYEYWSILHVRRVTHYFKEEENLSYDNGSSHRV
jgi:hypothetical protein